MRRSPAPRNPATAVSASLSTTSSQVPLALIVVLAVALRLLLLAHVVSQGPEYIAGDPDAAATAAAATDAPYLNDFGYEASNIALAWVCGGQGFAVSLPALVVVRRGRLTRLETALLLMSLAYTVPYLLTGIMERYRIPMTPAVVVALALVAERVVRWVHDRPTAARER